LKSLTQVFKKDHGSKEELGVKREYGSKEELGVKRRIGAKRS
jgi:hypothetical protein